MNGVARGDRYLITEFGRHIGDGAFLGKLAQLARHASFANTYSVAAI